MYIWMQLRKRMIMVDEWWSSVQRGGYVRATYFKHKLHTYTRVARGQDGVEVKSMIDLVLVKKDMLHYVQDVMTVGEMGQGLSDQHFILCKVRLGWGAWIKRREVKRDREFDDDELGGFRAGRECIPQIFTIKQFDEKA